MSGGSYNYLCEREENIPDQLDEMADRLDELAPESLAAVQTRALLNDWRELLARFDDKALRGVWQAVEWHDSRDGYEGQVDDALAMHERGDIYQGRPPTPRNGWPNLGG